MERSDHNANGDCIMAKTNPSTTKRATMLADLNDAAQAFTQGAIGFLFAVQMPDGSLQWIAGGDLAGYDNATTGAAMRLYVEAQRVALKAA
jgi:hypothetical protein